MTDDIDASGRQGGAVTQNSISRHGTDAFTTTTAATLRSQISLLSAKNRAPLFPFCPDQHHPEVSGQQMLEVGLRKDWKNFFFCIFLTEGLGKTPVSSNSHSVHSLRMLENSI